MNGTSITKFLDADDENEISITKFMEFENDISVTKFLDDRTPTYNTMQGTDVHNRNVNMTIIQFLEEYLWDNGHELSQDNEISITKFLDSPQANIATSQFENGSQMNVITFLQSMLDKPEYNDISVTKFLHELDNYLSGPAQHDLNNMSAYLQ